MTTAINLSLLLDLALPLGYGIEVGDSITTTDAQEELATSSRGSGGQAYIDQNKTRLVARVAERPRTSTIIDTFRLMSYDQFQLRRCRKRGGRGPVEQTVEDRSSSRRRAKQDFGEAPGHDQAQRYSARLKTHKTEAKQATLNCIAELCEWMIPHGFIIVPTKQPEPAQVALSAQAESLDRSTEDGIISTEDKAASVIEDNVTFTKDKDASIIEEDPTLTKDKDVSIVKEKDTNTQDKDAYIGEKDTAEAQPPGPVSQGTSNKFKAAESHDSDFDSRQPDINVDRLYQQVALLSPTDERFASVHRFLSDFKEGQYHGLRLRKHSFLGSDSARFADIKLHVLWLRLRVEPSTFGKKTKSLPLRCAELMCLMQVKIVVDDHVLRWDGAARTQQESLIALLRDLDERVAESRTSISSRAVVVDEGDSSSTKLLKMFPETGKRSHSPDGPEQPGQKISRQGSSNDLSVNRGLTVRDSADVDAQLKDALAEDYARTSKLTHDKARVLMGAVEDILVAAIWHFMKRYLPAWVEKPKHRNGKGWYTPGMIELPDWARDMYKENPRDFFAPLQFDREDNPQTVRLLIGRLPEIRNIRAHGKRVVSYSAKHLISHAKDALKLTTMMGSRAQDSLKKIIDLTVDCHKTIAVDAEATRQRYAPRLRESQQSSQSDLRETLLDLRDELRHNRVRHSEDLASVIAFYVGSGEKGSLGVLWDLKETR